MSSGARIDARKPRDSGPSGPERETIPAAAGRVPLGARSVAAELGEPAQILEHLDPSG